MTDQGTEQGGFSKTHHFGKWSRDRFADAVVVTGPQKTIYLSGIGAEDADADTVRIRHLGDAAGQARYAHEKLERLLAEHGATLAHVVKTVAYVTDVRYKSDYAAARVAAYADYELPTHTMLVITALAHTGMLIEMDVTAVVPA
ncbi:MAG TPA: RidA family protein [Microbacteriaceae bacterium]|nr:RidA family protein [Microbacteriaceae bacterium]